MRTHRVGRIFFAVAEEERGVRTTPQNVFIRSSVLTLPKERFIVNAARFGGALCATLSPFPSAWKGSEVCQNIAHTKLYPYGEHPSVTISLTLTNPQGGAFFCCRRGGTWDANPAAAHHSDPLLISTKDKHICRNACAHEHSVYLRNFNTQPGVLRNRARCDESAARVLSGGERDVCCARDGHVRLMRRQGLALAGWCDPVLLRA